MKDDMIRTFEIFTERYSEIIQAENMVVAIQVFLGKIETMPLPLIISVEDVTFREANVNSNPLGKATGIHEPECQSLYIHNPEPLPCNCSKQSKWDNIPVCTHDYYAVRSGKCKHASVHHGNIYCNHPNCNP